MTISNTSPAPVAAVAATPAAAPEAAPARGLRPAPGANISPPTPVTRPEQRAPSTGRQMADKLNAEVAAKRAANGQFAATGEAAPAADPAAPAVAAPETPTAPAAAEPTTPAVEAPKAADGKAALERSQLLQKLARHEADVLTHKSTAEKATAENAALKAQLAKFEEARKDPNKLLALGNLGPDELGQLFLKNELNFKPAAPEQPEFKLPPDIAEAVEYAKQAKERETRETQQRAATEARATDVKTIGEAVQSVAADFPLVAAMPAAADMLLNMMVQRAEANGGKEPDFHAVLTEYNNAVLSDLKAVVGNKVALKAALGDESSRTLALEVLREMGALAAAPVVVETPAVAAPVVAAPSRTLTNKNSSAVPSRAVGTRASSADIAARVNAQRNGGV